LIFRCASFQKWRLKWELATTPAIGVILLVVIARLRTLLYAGMAGPSLRQRKILARDN